MNFLTVYPQLLKYVAGWALLGLVSYLAYRFLLDRSRPELRRSRRRIFLTGASVYGLVMGSVAALVIHSAYKPVSKDFAKAETLWNRAMAARGTKGIPVRNLAGMTVSADSFPPFEGVLGLNHFKINGLPPGEKITHVLVPIGYDEVRTTAALKAGEARYFPEISKEKYILAGVLEHKINLQTLFWRTTILFLLLLVPPSLFAAPAAGMFTLLVFHLFGRGPKYTSAASPSSRRTRTEPFRGPATRRA